MAKKAPEKKFIKEELTDKQRLFVHEYLKDLNASKAALRAGYSEASAYNQGYELMKMPLVQAEIQKAMDERAERVNISAAKILKRLDDIADIDIGEAYDDNGRLLPIKEMPVHIRKAISSVKVYEDFIDSTKIGEIREVKFWDKLKSNELLGKHLKLFTDVLDVNDSSIADKMRKARERASRK